MKKLLVIISCLALVLSLSVLSVSAATDGFDFASTAKSVKFNSSLSGEDVVIVTENDAVANANLKWATSVVLDATDTAGVYTVVLVHVGDGNNPAITLEEGQILMGVHSATGDPAQEATYQNVNGKLAASALEAGDILVFTGVDFETLTVSEGATIVADGKAPVDESEPTDESTPADESEPANESTPTDESVPADTSAPADTSVDASSDASVSDTANGGNNTWIYIVCAVAAVIIVAVVVVMVKKK